jgi:hypothetical protein
LFRFIDHAHAAAADLPHNPKVTQLGRRVGSELTDAVDKVHAGQALLQLRRQLGVLSQEFRAVGRPPCLQVSQVLIQYAHQGRGGVLRVVWPRARRQRRLDGSGASFDHGLTPERMR